MKHRSQRMQEELPQEVERVTRILLHGPELFALVKGELVLPQRGALPFMKVLDQALDRVNVIALKLSISDRPFPEIRRLDKNLGDKILRLVSKERKGGNGRGHSIEVGAVAIIG